MLVKGVPGVRYKSPNHTICCRKSIQCYRRRNPTRYFCRNPLLKLEHYSFHFLFETSHWIKYGNVQSRINSATSNAVGADNRSMNDETHTDSKRTLLLEENVLMSHNLLSACKSPETFLTDWKRKSLFRTSNDPNKFTRKQAQLESHHHTCW